MNDLFFQQNFSGSAGQQDYFSSVPGVCTPRQSSSPPTPCTQRTPRDGSRASTQIRDQPGLRFLELDEWDASNSYEEDNEPTLIHYAIEWKVVLNNRVIARDTEQDVVLQPVAYWHMVLRPKLESLVQKKVSASRQVRCDDTDVKVLVADRTQRDLLKRFDDLNIDWPLIAKQLDSWSERFRSGRKLRVELSFNYIDTQAASAPAGRAVDKRGSSATQRMLAERATQLDAEEVTTGAPSIWREVYALMRCPGPSCDGGPHCWRDPFGKKYYKLRTHHLKALVDLVEQGYVLKDHDDVPAEIREQLVAEERQRLERQPKSVSEHSTPSYLPITITNVLPPTQQSPPSSLVDVPTVVMKASRHVSLDIPGPRDLAVKAYSEWQQSNVVDEDLKEDFRRAGDVTLQDGMDLEQVHEDQDPHFFIKSGIKRGVARRFIRDIEAWAKDYRAPHDDIITM